MRHVAHRGALSSGRDRLTTGPVKKKNIDLPRNVWFCFTGCRAGGDVIDLVQRLDQVGFAQAVGRLAAMDLPRILEAPTNPPHPRPFQPYTRSLSLREDAPFLRRKGILPHTARRFEVGAYDGPGWLASCVAVRLHDPEGHPLGYAGRLLDAPRAQQLGKWRFPPGLPKSSLLYGYHRLPHHARDALVVTECPWGVLRLHQLAIPAVALLGCRLSQRQRSLLARANPVLLLLDGDPAGRHAAVAINQALHFLTAVHVLALPEGCDPDDLTDPDLLTACRRYLDA
jgi:DNA primase